MLNNIPIFLSLFPQNAYQGLEAHLQHLKMVPSRGKGQGEERNEDGSHNQWVFSLGEVLVARFGSRFWLSPWRLKYLGLKFLFFEEMRYLSFNL